jgi:DNA-binding transcriptional regulator LsrR (DeoR family)
MSNDGQPGAPPEAIGYELARVIYRVLVMYYGERKTQAEIAKLTGHSVAKVNRLIRLGRETGMVEITLRPLYAEAMHLEHDLVAQTGLAEAMVVPTASEDYELNLAAVGQAAASFLLAHIKDGDTICISGGKGVSALVDGLKPDRKYDVTVVPATGLVQSRHYIDVNHVSSEMAARLGGKAYQIHAPMFADSVEQRDVLREVSAVRDVLDKARQATTAVVGIGSVHAPGSTYPDLGPLAGPQNKRAAVAAAAEGEILAHLITKDGQLVAGYAPNELLVGLTPADLRAIPFSIGVAAGSLKVGPIRSVLRGGYLKGLVTDEKTSSGVLELWRPPT